MASRYRQLEQESACLRNQMTDVRNAMDQANKDWAEAQKELDDLTALIH